MKFFILSALFLAQTALASNAPTKLNLQALDSKFITINNKDQVTVLNNLQSALKQISGGSLQLPATIGLVIPQTYDSPFFDPSANTLVAPYQMVIDGMSKNPVFTRAVELHEFGHAIFNENLELVFKNQPELLRVTKAAKAVLNKTAATRMKLLRRDIVSELLARKIEATKASDSSPMMQEFEAISQSLQNEEAQLMSVYSTNQVKIEAFGNLMQATSQYNEFFADVVSVVITENPQSIANALHFSNDTQINYTDRSFARRRGKKELASDAHNFYSLSRNYIYKYYLSNPVYKAKGKSWLINKTLLAVSCGINIQTSAIEQIKKEAVEVLRKRPKADINAFVLERMNDALNECVDNTFN